jgi:hypothetical protein
METELTLESQTIRFDRDATIGLYRDVILTPGADQCTCLSCKNFATQRNFAYSDEFLQLLDDLGADPLKEWEAFDLDFGSNPDRHVYGGWFLFCGELLQDSREKRNSEPFSYKFTTSFPNGTLPCDTKICAVEFMTAVPWVLPEMLQ